MLFLCVYVFINGIETTIRSDHLSQLQTLDGNFKQCICRIDQLQIKRILSNILNKAF